MKTKLDLRTIEGRRQEILERVKRWQGFSDFWITDNPLRAIVFQRMIDSGELKASRMSKYPLLRVRVMKKHNESKNQ